jgi:hypothetical protein
VRRRTAPQLNGHAAAAPPAPLTDRVVHPHGVYRLDELTALLRLKKSSLRREVKEKRLRVSRRCGCYFFIGKAVLDWLAGGEDWNAVRAT